MHATILHVPPSSIFSTAIRSYKSMILNSYTANWPLSKVCMQQLYNKILMAIYNLFSVTSVTI